MIESVHTSSDITCWFCGKLMEVQSQEGNSRVLKPCPCEAEREVRIRETKTWEATCKEWELAALGDEKAGDSQADGWKEPESA